MRKPFLCLAALVAAFVLVAGGQPGAVNAASLPEFAELAAKCGPAVVNINTEKTTKQAGPEDFFGEMFRNMPPGFERFFEPFAPNKRRPNMKKQKSLGSGFLVSEDGYIVTNFHVVDGADVIHVTLDEKAAKNRSNIKATLVGSDEETDLALLKIDVKEKLPYLSFGNSDELKVGEWVLAIGNPFGLDHSVTAGILSATGRRISAGAFDNFLQTDASINPGNSGGPLINMRGEVIGINTAIIASGQGIGFAIPSNMANDIIGQVRDGKKVSRGWLGITIQDVDEAVARALALKDHRGALVIAVQPGQPADDAGMKEGDIIVRIDDQDIEDRDELLRVVASKKPGTEAKVVVLREGKEVSLKVKLGDRSSNREVALGQSGGKDVNEDNLGVKVRPVTSEEARSLDIDAGLMIVGIDEEKPAAGADLRAGDVIVKVNMKPVKTVSDLARIVRDEGMKRGSILLQINRRGDLVFRTVELDEEK